MHNMQNPYGIFSVDTIDNDIFINGETIEAGAQVMVSPPANVRIFSKQADGFHKPVNEAIGLEFAVLSDMAPNGEHVTARALCKPVMRHQSRARASRFSSPAS
jgi:hypothetical protein